LESKFQRNCGLAIGLGLGVLLLGLLGLMFANQNYNDVARYVNYHGTRDGDWLFRDLTRQIAIFCSVSVTGAITVLWGWLKLRSKSARQEILCKYPVRNGMIGAGGAVAFISLQHLFMYLLIGDSFQLFLFSLPFAFGVVLVACGFAVKS